MNTSPAIIVGLSITCLGVIAFAILLIVADSWNKETRVGVWLILSFLGVWATITMILKWWM